MMNVANDEDDDLCALGLIVLGLTERMRLSRSTSDPVRSSEFTMKNGSSPHYLDKNQCDEILI